MIITCEECSPGNVISFKEPFENDEPVKGLCRYHLLQSMEFNECINPEERDELQAWKRLFRSRRNDE